MTTELGKLNQLTALSPRLAVILDQARRYPPLSVVPASEAAEAGVQWVLEGKAAALVKGWIHTDELMRPVLRQLRTARRVSQIGRAHV